MKVEHGVDVKTIPGNRGEFSVWIGDELIAQKTLDGFPAEDELVATLAARLGA